MRRIRCTSMCFVMAAGLAAAAVVTHAAGRGPRVERLRRMVVIGDSLLAGFISGGFVARDQRRSAPALIARRASVKLSQPLMSGAGVPPPLRLVRLPWRSPPDRGGLFVTDREDRFRPLRREFASR